MIASTQNVVGKLTSLRNSLAKTIIALRAHEQTARDAGDHDTADELALERLALNDKSIVIWQAEAAAAEGDSLAVQINALKKISKDAKDATGRLETIAKALEAATKLLTLLEKLSALLA